MKAPDKKIKLLKKISQKQLQFGLVIILGSLIFLYFLTRYYIVSETEESLNNTTFRIEQLLKNNKNITSLPPIFEIHEITELKASNVKDTLIFDELQKELEMFKELNTYETINGKNYHIITRSLIVEYDDTLFSIVMVLGIIISLVYLAQYYFSKQINKMIWQPFFHNLDAIKQFTLSTNVPIELQSSDVLEFSELNTQIRALTTKVATDYQNLKQFTEDLSHEVQTPLAIIQAKIENLIDSSTDLEAEHIAILVDIQNNSKRLSKLNKGLILLTKIENQQFTELEEIEVNAIVNSLIQDLQDISDIKKLSVQLTEHQNIKLMMDKVLADILFSNLIGNAIKHTPKNGSIHVIIEKNIFKVSNTGDKAVTNADQLFQRFYKEDRTSQSLGLGLAIVKKICDYYQFDIQYSYNHNQHSYSITFNS